MSAKYWKKESIVDNRPLALVKEENGEGYYFKNGEWHNDYDAVVKAKWDGDYESIPASEANRIMKQL